MYSDDKIAAALIHSYFPAPQLLSYFLKGSEDYG